MISILIVFYLFVGLFAIMGAMRGWAKELLVVFSVVLARFVEDVFSKHVPGINVYFQSLINESPENKTWFYIRSLLFVVMVAFGYATTVISQPLGSRARKEKFQDTLLGFFLGAINGYLIVGVLWGFLDAQTYNIWNIVPPASQAAAGLIDYLPTVWLQGSTLWVSTAVSFAFVLIVFV